MNILTIDVEEIFHADYVKNSPTDRTVQRTPHNLPIILEMLDNFNIKATFFIVGEIAENYPELLCKIHSKGHEIAFHSQDHKPIWEKTAELVEKELANFNTLLLSTTGQKCKGFRAPSFSFSNRTIWLLSALENAGLLYDSSIFPAWTPLYGTPNAPLHPYKPSKKNIAKKDENGDLWEFPLATYPFLFFRIPTAGGFYLRFIPSLVKKSIRKMNSLGYPAVVYIHTWELDSETTRARLGLYKSFVTYHNIDKTERLFKELLKDFDFTSFAEHMATNGMA